MSKEDLTGQSGIEQSHDSRLSEATRRRVERRSVSGLSYRALGEFCDALSESIEAVECVVNRYPQFPKLSSMLEEGRTENRIPVPPPDEEWANRMRSETLSEFERVAGYARLLSAIRREPHSRSKS